MHAMASATVISKSTREGFAHAIGSSRVARDILTAIEDHAFAVNLRIGAIGMPWQDLAAWPSKMTRRQLPGMATNSHTMRADAGLRCSTAIDRDTAADMANRIMFDLIMEGEA